MKLQLLTFLWVFFFGAAQSLYAQGSGRMLELNGSSSYVSTGSINLSGGSITMMCWVKPKTFKSSNPYISSLMGTEVGTNSALLRLGDGGLAAEKVQFVLRIGSGQTKLDGNKSLKANQWYHIAATYDGSTMRIYIDGILDASKSQTGSITSNSTFEIGRNYANSRILDGQIDEVSVWNTGLSQATIRDWMCQTITSTHPNYSNLQGYWKFDEASGGTTTDHSGNNRTGTLQSSPLRKLSEAPIGDKSVYSYSSPSSMFLSHPDGDSLVISNISGAPLGIHLYRVDKKANSSNFPATVGNHDTTRYYGVHFIEGSSPTATLDYFYTKNTFYKNNTTCFIDLATRANNATTNWLKLNAQQSSSALNKTAQKAGEYIMVFASNKSIHQNASATICDGDSVQLANTTNGFTYRWYKNNIALSADTLNQLKVSQAGTYFLTIQQGSCIDTSNNFALTVNNRPSVAMSTIQPICHYDSLHPIGGGTPSGGVYQNTFMSGNLFAVLNAGPGTHKITYRYTDPNTNCSDTASKTIVVHPLPQITLPTIPDLCADSGAFNLSGATPTGGTYTVNNANATTFDASSLGVGTHTLGYTFTDSKGCKNSKTNSVNVVALPNVTLNIPKKSICEDVKPIAIDGANPRGGTFSGKGVAGFNFSPRGAGPGKHPISYQYTDPNTGCKNNAYDTMTVHPIPTKPVVTQNGNELSTGNADTYQWYGVNGEITGETNSTYKPVRNGTYHVVVTKNGCTSEPSDPFDYKNTVGIYETLSHYGLKAYPIPADDVLSITSNHLALHSVKLFSIQGKHLPVGIQMYSDTEVELDLTNIQSGLYLLSVTLENGDQITSRLIKQ